ncbi:MAG: metal ABC transporter permease [Pseudomonadota bacterium]
MTPEWSILWPALLAGLLVLSTHVPLGREVLARGIIFLDLAIAQIAALGVVIAVALGGEINGWQVQLTAVAAALCGAALLRWTESRWPEIQEAVIGSAFVLAATAAILLLHGHPHGAEEMKDLLSGQLLWVSPQQLLPVALLYAVVLAVWFGGRERIGRIGFYGLFALAVTASVQLVGVYLVFASLILPALAVRRLPQRQALVTAYALGAFGYAMGLIVSTWFDWPAGPLVVWMLAITALCGGWWGCRKA